MTIYSGFTHWKWWFSIYLVGGFKHFLFSIIDGIILPIGFHIFQRGCNHQPDTMSRWHVQVCTHPSYMFCSTLFKVLEWFWIETPMVAVQQPCRSRTATAAVAEEKRTEVSVRRAGSDNVQLSQKHSEWNIHINPPCPLDFQQTLQVQMEGKSASPEKISGSKTKLSWGFSGFRRYRFSHRSTRRRLQLDFLGHRCDSADTATRWLHYGWSYLVKQVKFSNGDHYALWFHYDPMRYWLRPGQIETLKKKVYHPSNWHAFHGVKKKCRFSGWNWACCGEGIL